MLRGYPTPKNDDSFGEAIGDAKPLFSGRYSPLCCVRFIYWGATYLPSYQECAATYEQQHPRTNSADPYQPATQFLRCEGVVIDANNGTLTAVATIFLAVITGWLVVVARDQSKTTRAQLRAYIFVRGKVDTEPVFDDKEGIIVWFAAHNSGQTPAYKVRQWITTDFVADPHNGQFKPPPEPLQSPETAIGPGHDISLRAIYPRAMITDEHVRETLAGRLTICIWGEVTYEDVFGRPHFSRFRFFVPVESDRTIRGVQVSRGGNEAN